MGEHTLHARTLERTLARDPQFFVDCLKVLYRPRHEASEKEQTEPKEPDQYDAQKATLLWRLLNEWRYKES